jgi:hypothetical protein
VRPGSTVALHRRSEFGVIRGSSSMRKLRSPLSVNEYQESDPTTCRCVSRIEPNVAGTAVSKCPGPRDKHASINRTAAHTWCPNASSRRDSPIRPVTDGGPSGPPDIGPEPPASSRKPVSRSGRNPPRTWTLPTNYRSRCRSRPTLANRR